MDLTDIADNLDEIDRIATQAGVRPSLVHAVIRQESGGNSQAKSPKGASGLMQLMPGTAQEMGVKDPTNAMQNVQGGVKYLAQQLKRFNGDEKLALAAYNAGPGNAQRALTRFPETQKYVQNIQSGDAHTPELSMADIADELMVEKPETPVPGRTVYTPEAPPKDSPDPAQQKFNEEHTYKGEKKAEDPSVGNQVWDLGKHLVKGAWDTANPLAIIEALKDPKKAVAGIIDASASQVMQAKDAWNRAGRSGKWQDYLEAIGHAGGMVPVIGPMAVGAGETIAKAGEKGDFSTPEGRNQIAEGLGQGVGLLAGPKLVKEGVGIASKVAGKTVVPLARAIPESLMNSAQKFTKTIRDDNPNVNLARTALKEGVGASDWGMEKAARLATKVREIKNRLYDEYPGLKTDAPQKLLTVLDEEADRLKAGAASADDIAEVMSLRNEVANNPRMSRMTFRLQPTATTQQVATGAVDNAGRPIMQSQTVMVPRLVENGRVPIRIPTEATREASLIESENTRGLHGRTIVAPLEETTARKLMRSTETNALKETFDPLVKRDRAGIKGSIQRAVDSALPDKWKTEPQTFSELSKREGDLIGLRKGLEAGEARRNNMNTVSPWLAAAGAGYAQMTGDVMGGVYGTLAAHAVRSPKGMGMIARGVNAPIEAGIRVAKLAGEGAPGLVRPAQAAHVAQGRPVGKDELMKFSTQLKVDPKTLMPLLAHTPADASDEEKLSVLKQLLLGPMGPKVRPGVFQDSGSTN